MNGGGKPVEDGAGSVTWVCLLSGDGLPEPFSRRATTALVTTDATPLSRIPDCSKRPGPRRLVDCGDSLPTTSST